MGVIMLLCLANIPGIQAQSFNNLWKQVDQAEKNSLPETVVKLTDEIYRKGVKEKNSPQMLKAYIWRMKYRETITPDSFYVNLKGLEQWVKQTVVPMDRAILHSLLAEIYANYAVKNSWTLWRRSEILEEVPDDIQEWTENIFVDKVRMHACEAVADSVLLLETSSRTYLPFVELGETSEYYHHDMYHLLVSRSIEALRKMNDSNFDRSRNVKPDIAELYNNMLSTYQRKDDKEGYVLVSLNCLKWQDEIKSDKDSLISLPQNFYVAELDKLLEDYKSLEICAEVYRAKAEYALSNGRRVAALQICDDAIRLYPDYFRINVLKNIRRNILTPTLTVDIGRSAFPGEKMEIRVNHNNLDGFTIQLYQSKNLVSEQHCSLIRSKEYESKDTVLTYHAPEEVGAYTMRIVPDDFTEKISEKEFAVTRFKVLTCSLPQHQLGVLTLDAQTGHPISNARVAFYSSNNQVQIFNTGEDGKIVVPWRSAYRELIAIKGNDKAMPRQFIPAGGIGRFTNEEVKENVILLTDRALYRPGQTVYVKGIAYKQELDSAHVISNKEYTITLISANAQEVGKKTLRTNEYGSFTTTFTLPSICLNGRFILKVPNGEVDIHVEDYKRPTFDITFEKQQGSYQLGDEVLVKGKVQAFSGILLQNLPVKYKIMRLDYNLWHFTDVVQMASGEVVANDKGEFTIPVRLEENKRYENDDKRYYHYKIETTVTNASGETQMSTHIIAAGNRSLNLQAVCEERACKDDSVEVMFRVQNLNMQPIEMEGTYRLFRSKDKLMKELEEVAAVTGTFISNKAMKFDWRNLPSGAYVLKMSGKDSQDKEVTVDTGIVLFSADDRRPPVETPSWFYESNVKFDAMHPAVFYFGTSEKNAHVMINIFNETESLESRILNLSDSIVRFEYPYQTSYGDGITVNICMVKDGKIYQEQARLEKRIPQKKLSMKWEVFRDKLSPGQKEEWKLTIKTPQGQPANAEMLATMYDASLDKIWSNQPMYFLPYMRRIPSIRWRGGEILNNRFDYWYNSFFKTPMLKYDHFMVQPSASVEESFEGSSTEFKIRGSAARKKITVTGAITNVDVAQLKLSASYDALAGCSPGVIETYIEPTTSVRTNLSETAFFYPQLRTNERGEISFSFTMPESLTRWNFRGYSHTKNMMLGTLDGEATTSKEFMLTPNLPRFVRVGDKTSIAASLSNMTGKKQSGTVSMILFDPMTDKVINIQKQDFAIEAGKAIGVNFLFTVSGEYEVVGCRIVADSGTFSDGEQQLLPILTDREHLVETLPIPVRGEETRTFSLDSLFNHQSETVTDRRLTIEFTGNPSWCAVQALPSLALPTDDNAISWSIAYYANTLAAYIMKNQPRIKAVFDSWKQQKGTKESFLSNLQKNQGVKDILLSESPWVLEAQTEEQQKERIATLFDLNNILSNNSAALTRLQKLQDSNGAWPWYKGMSASRFVTTFILGLNARLAMLTGEKPAGIALKMQRTAFNYLHQSILEEYKQHLKAQKEDMKSIGVSGSILDYLYLIAITGEEVPADNKAAYDYYMSKVGEMLSSSSMDAKAIAAIILTKAGRPEEAQKFIASLKEHLTKTDEQGMFFAFHENPYTWGNMKLQTHIDVMEALELVGGNDAIVEEMELWLLKQKQTQQWNSPLASADAIYALLMRGSTLLDNQGDVRITIADETLETTSPSKTTVPGLGYMKRSFTQKDVVEARSIKVEKKNPGIAWGAVYAEYESSIRDVKQQGGALNVQKLLYVERMVNNVAQLQPITEKTVLRVGDKVVSRLSIRVDRSMDFVQLKDQRGACFEPIANTSGYRWNSGLGYYVDVKDASTNFFFDHLGKGTYMLEYSYYVSREGTYETGLATMQCAYAPEYASHSVSTTVVVASPLTE